MQGVATSWSLSHCLFSSSPCRIQLKKVMESLEHHARSQIELSDMVKELVRQRLPSIMEDIVHKNSAEVIESIGGTSTRSAREIEDRVHQRVVEEVMHMLESATDDVVERISGMIGLPAIQEEEPPV